MSEHRMYRRARLAGATILAMLVTATLAACGSAGNPQAGRDANTPAASGAVTAAPTTAEAPSTGHNDADIQFAQMMIPHHTQAVQMSELATSRATDPQVKQLAGQIAAAQSPEIEAMLGWLKSWNAPTAAPGDGSMGGMHGSGSGHGMVPQADMDKLIVLNGADFDRSFVQLMIAHHNGAIQMARDEQNSGTNTAAKELAGRIVSSQQAEVGTLQKILGRL